jgi:hypothetical protein
MQNVPGQGDFEHYQGIWRLQRLPNCAPDGGDACRLTYAVELRPKGFLPVGLIEGRIAVDLKNNLDAIRGYVEAKTTAAAKGAGAGGNECSEINAAADVTSSDVDAGSRTALDTVLETIKLAQINSILTDAAAAAANDADDTNSSNSGSNSSGGGGGGGGSSRSSGDAYSPKSWSFRRLLLTGSAEPEPEVAKLISTVDGLRCQVKRAERALGRRETAAAAVEKAVQELPSSSQKKGRLATICVEISSNKRQNQLQMVAFNKKDEDERAAASAEGGGDVISPDEWSVRRLAITGSAVADRDRAYAGLRCSEGRLRARLALLEAQLAAVDTTLLRVAALFSDASYAGDDGAM